MPTTPDTGSYLILGLAVSFGILFAYVANLLLRYRSLQADEATLRELE